MGAFRAAMCISASSDRADHALSAEDLLVVTLSGKAEAIARQLNERPRETLGYEIRVERFNACVASTC